MERWMSFRTEPSGGASGQASDIAIHAKEILRIRHLLTSIYQKHCSKPDESREAGLLRFGRSSAANHLQPNTEHGNPKFRDSARKGLLHDRHVNRPLLV